MDMMNTPALPRSRMYLLQYVPPCTYPLPQPLTQPIDAIPSHPFDSQLFTNTPGSHLGLTSLHVGSVGSRLTCRQLHCIIIKHLSKT